MKTYQFPQSINEAALILDKVSPGWWKRIKMDTLNMNDGKMCILGQTFKRRAKNGFDWAIYNLFGGSSVVPSHYLSEAPFGYMTAKEDWASQIEMRKRIAGAA